MCVCVCVCACVRAVCVCVRARACHVWCVCLCVFPLSSGGRERAQVVEFSLNRRREKRSDVERSWVEFFPSSSVQNQTLDKDILSGCIMERRRGESAAGILSPS